MSALILVDIQNDFLPGGALAVPGGDEIIPVVNQIQGQFDLVVATQDWHPANHGSFAVNHPGRKPGEMIDLHGLQQILWPAHCVQGMPGADFAPSLDRALWDHVVFKGTDPAIDSYSGFFDNGGRRSTGLGEYLRGKRVSTVHVVGLATDYCVKFTVLDALKLGFQTVLIEDACRGINLRSGDTRRAVEEMKAAGATITSAEASTLDATL